MTSSENVVTVWAQDWWGHKEGSVQRLDFQTEKGKHVEEHGEPQAVSIRWPCGHRVHMARTTAKAKVAHPAGSPHVHRGQAATKEMALQMHPGSFSRLCVSAETLLFGSERSEEVEADERADMLWYFLCSHVEVRSPRAVTWRRERSSKVGLRSPPLGVRLHFSLTYIGSDPS